MFIIFGQQDCKSDRFHRAVDFIGCVTENTFQLSEAEAMPYKITMEQSDRVSFPQKFYGGV